MRQVAATRAITPQQQLDGQRTANTCANLLKLWPALWGFLWGFITHPGVEPTNNATEQALRGIVFKRKISAPTRSRRGDEFIARGFSVHETCRRQGLDLWAYLHRAVVAWIDKAPPKWAASPCTRWPARHAVGVLLERQVGRHSWMRLRTNAQPDEDRNAEQA